MKELTERIGKRMAERIPSFSFKSRGNAGIYRPLENGWQGVTLDVQRTSSPEVFRLAAHAQIRIDALEALYTPHHPYLTPKSAKTHATLSINAEQLIKNTALIHGFACDPASVDGFAEAYAEEIRANVIPWLDRYSDEEALFAGLADPDPMNWITSDRLTRFPVLMAILAKRGDLTAFDTVAAEFQDWCKQKHALVYAPMAETMLKMRAG